MDEQQEQILRLELKVEKMALDHKIKVQEKDDALGEEGMNLRHKESELREAKRALERAREDIGFRVQEAVDRVQDRLASEKQADMEAINRRNEMLIRSLVDNHCAEAKMLRERLLNQERQKRDCEQLMVNLEIELNQHKDDSKERLNQSELDEMQARSIEANAQRLQQMHAKYGEEINQLKDAILQLEDHINNLQTAKSEAD